MNKIVSALLVYAFKYMAASFEVISFTRILSITDSEIKTFDTSHAIYINLDPAAQGWRLVWEASRWVCKG
jgi:hypothetical protein